MTVPSKIYTDGSFRYKSKSGGWGLVAKGVDGQTLFESGGFKRETSNVEMELMAVAQGLNFILKSLQDSKISSTHFVEFCCDFQLCVFLLSELGNEWKENGWRSKAGGLLADANLMAYCHQLKIQIESMNCIVSASWIKAHNNNADNERADKISKAFSAALDTKRAISSCLISDFKKPFRVKPDRVLQHIQFRRHSFLSQLAAALLVPSNKCYILVEPDAKLASSSARCIAVSEPRLLAQDFKDVAMVCHPKLASASRLYVVAHQDLAQVLARFQQAKIKVDQIFQLQQSQAECQS
jgi:ribonuclease HI